MSDRPNDLKDLKDLGDLLIDDLLIGKPFNAHAMDASASSMVLRA